MATMQAMNPEIDTQRERLAAWNRAYAKHLTDVGAHPMCIGCTEVEASIRHASQSIRIIERGGRTLPRYIEAINA